MLVFPRNSRTNSRSSGEYCSFVEIAFAVLTVLSSHASTIAQNADIASVTTSLSELPPSQFWLAPSEKGSRDAWETPTSEIVNAIVVEIDERNMICVARDKPTTPEKFDSYRLHAVEVSWASEKAASAHSAFVRNDFAAAIESSKQAIAEGKMPRWQQKILAAEITDSLIHLGQTTNACRIFISLCKESPAPMLYASAPLNWNSQRANTQILQQAEEWIQSDRTPIEQLIGASWLLNGNDATKVRSTLEALQKNKSSVIVQLATAQGWRLELPNQIAERYPQWSEYRDRMLLPLQVGPTIAIADKLERAGLKEKALQEWLRIVAIHPERRKEFVLARDAAVDLLKQLGRTDEAKRLIEKAK
jgi:tetratricopeptide (TPR) repeat protein